jgi:hypothetical protein
MQFQKPTNEQLNNRYCYHKPTDEQASVYGNIRSECLALAKLIVAVTPCSPEQARALNALDEVMFLANAAIARNTPKLECPTQSIDKNQ